MTIISEDRASAATRSQRGAVARSPGRACCRAFAGEAASGVRLFDAAAFAEDFPILREKVHGRAHLVGQRRDDAEAAGRD